MRTLRRRKESYVGPWLPEPLLTAPDVAEDVELADTVSMAMMLVLETLTPDRAGGVRAARGVRPGVRRDRGRGRQDPDRVRRSRTGHGPSRGPPTTVDVSPPSPERCSAFQRAVETGDLQGLLDILAPGVVLLAEGRVARRPRCPSSGPRKLAGFLTRIPPTASLHPVEVNGQPALVVRFDGGSTR